MPRLLGEDWLKPGLDDLNRPWFTSGTIQIQCCNDCNTLQHPPEEICHACQGTQLGSRTCSGEGRIESVAVVHKEVHPALKNALPYAIVVVSLADAPEISALGNVLNRDPADIRIGDAVRAVFEEIPASESHERMLIPQWQVV